MPSVRPLPEHRWVLLAEYTHTWVHEGVEYSLSIPEGFVFDFASVPRIVWALISPMDLGAAPPLVHDWMYHLRGRTPMLVDGRVRVPKWSRKDADRLFARMMREAGVAKWRRRMAYRAVRLFGGRPFRKGGW